MPPNTKSITRDPDISNDTSDSNRDSNVREILYEGYFYDVTEWIHRHPGGRIIEFYTNKEEDSTEAINQFHYRTMKTVRVILKSLKRRKACPSEMNLSSKTIEKNRAMTEDFSKLYHEIKEEGLFEPSYTHNIIRTLEVLTIGFVGYHIFFYESWALKLLGIFLIGLAHGRSGWLQHEFGHNSITGNPKWEKWGHAIFFGVGLGLSAKGWQVRHNRHHAMPNRVEHDMDIHLTPIIIQSVKTLKDPKKDTNWILEHQAWMFPILQYVYILSIQLYYMPRCSLRNHRYLELFSYVIHYSLAYYIGFIPYFFGANYIASYYLMTNFALAHSHFPATTEPTHWVEYGINYTCNVTPSWWCDWYMGYLNYQIEHHLFPAVPQFRHPLIVDRVKALAKKHGLTYQVLSYKDNFIKSLGHHWHVSQELKALHED